MTQGDGAGTLDIEAALIGLLALAVADRDDRIRDQAGARKSELILADAGLSALQIARLLGKNVDAVRKAIQRGRSR